MAGLNRRHRLSRDEVAELESYFSKMPPPLLGAVYRALGGQPGRIGDEQRIVQLTVRAIAQGKRMAMLLKSMHEKQRTVLAILLQCGGLAHSREFLHELTLSLGGYEREWQKLLVELGDLGLVCASDPQDGEFFYLVPEPLVEHLLPGLTRELAIPTFASDDVKVEDQRPFSPSLDFSITTLCTYMDQRPPRLTQQQEIYKVHKDEMDRFFSQLWESGSELFHFHVNFLMLHGLVELRGDGISVNREVVEEWLNLDPQDQRDLIFRALDRDFRYAEWVLWAIHSGGGAWVPERPLSALYRRWMRGEDWRKRFHQGDYTPRRELERESWTFAPLVRRGMLESGEWGQEKFYRLTPRIRSMLEAPDDEGFKAFYLTPSFEVMAPAGLSPLVLFRIGEFAELTGCDRANTYKITEASIERALDRGWRRDDVLDFLRQNSQTGLPENVEQTIRSWMGHHGDVEFHDTVLLSVHRSRIRRLEGLRELKPYLLHRFTPGLYAVDRDKLPEIRSLLEECGFFPSREVTRYPGDPDQAGARERLLQLVVEAREAAENPVARSHAADTCPEDLRPVPGTHGAGGRRRKRRDLPPRVSPREARLLANRAITQRKDIELLYLARDGRRVTCKVAPERLAVSPAGDEVMVALDLAQRDRRTYKLARIERMRHLDPS